MQKTSSRTTCLEVFCIFLSTVVVVKWYEIWYDTVQSDIYHIV